MQNVIDWDKHTIVGTNQRLEKPYLRLTSVRPSGPLSVRHSAADFVASVPQEPDPATVRPLPVLRQTLELLKRKWKEEENYPYICDQFKSLRQDLTVSSDATVASHRAG